MLLALEPLWRDHDGMLEFRFSVHGSGFAAEINFYDYRRGDGDVRSYRA